MVIQSSRRLDLQNDRTQQRLDGIYQTYTNSVHCLSTDLIRIADCLIQQMHEINAIKQELRRAQVPSDRINKLKENLKKFQELKVSAVEELNKLADDLDKYFSRINKGLIGGSAVSITGGIIMIVGLALVPITFGTSVILSIAGGVVTGAGSGVAGGLTVFDWYQSRKSRKTVTKVLDKYNKALHQLKIDCLEIGSILNTNSTNMETENQSWCKFWSNFFLGTSTTSRISWNAIANPILLSFRLASAAEDAATLTVRGLMMAGTAPVIGSIVGICMIPFDIGVLVNAAIDVHKQNPHRDSNGIRNLAVKLNNNNPTDQDIENMIEATFQPRTIQNRESNV
ncbi:APOL [Mytilus coruscus]|uniref:APOL n=1 Tax=Mytilus coruscus TaxID=42192 RepID=A0A6J8E8Y3_MYTCO|nr:APOL [Mytilus coruscus]